MDTREENLSVDLDELTMSHIDNLTINRQECLPFFVLQLFYL